VIFHAEATKEAFRDMRIVTAASKYVDIAYNMALDNLKFIDDIKDLDITVTSVINAQTFSVREYVDIGRDGILVCINAPIIDENAMLSSLDMVAEALRQLNGGKGTIYFGNELTFAIKDIPWLFKY
jgi:hypothetical protein